MVLPGEVEYTCTLTQGIYYFTYAPEYMPQKMQKGWRLRAHRIGTLPAAPEQDPDLTCKPPVCVWVQHGNIERSIRFHTEHFAICIIWLCAYLGIIAVLSVCCLIALYRLQPLCQGTLVKYIHNVKRLYLVKIILKKGCMKLNKNANIGGPSRSQPSLNPQPFSNPLQLD